MPRSGKKGWKKNSGGTYSCADIKLGDFADNNVSAVRRKPTVNSLAREVKALCTLERSWFEDVSEVVNFFEDADVEVEEDDDDDEILKSVVNGDKDIPLKLCGRKHQNISTSQRKSRGIRKKPGDSSGQTYPLDLWFLISEYIRPEDVGTFAAICKSSYFVCQTYSFWINLYKRYYKPGTQLPSRLQPQSICRPPGLKVSVIRSLYYFYPRFTVFSISNLASQYNKDVYRVLKYICVSMWHSQVNNKWTFFFKFQSNMLNPRSKQSSDEFQRESCQWDTYEYQDQQQLINDVNINPEEGCVVLRITTPNFVAFPVVMGARLADVKFTLSRDMLKQRMQLIFSFSNYRQACKNAPQLVSRQCGGTGETLEFDPVDSAIVLDWWHPQYPAGNSFL